MVKSCVTDALLGLRELLEANPQLIDSSLATLINTCVRVIADEVSQPRFEYAAFLEIYRTQRTQVSAKLFCRLCHGFFRVYQQ